jgi:hypothetical protein
MTTLLTIKVTFASCGRTSNQTEIGSTSTFDWSDLDTRPAKNGFASAAVRAILRRRPSARPGTAPCRHPHVPPLNAMRLSCSE